MRIVVAMSGGVDSSVAAALLAEQGHDVIGVSMQLYASTRDGDNAVARSGQATRADDDGTQRWGTCCTIDDLYDARRVAATLGIPHYIVNFESQFGEHVVSNFVREYVAGRTPIPCSHCNSDLKFAELLDRATAYDAEQLATGHYARIERDADGRYHLHRGADTSKDQTYFLFSLTQAQLAVAIGVSERTVQNWEAGRVSPQAERRLRDLIELNETVARYITPDHRQAWLISPNDAFAGDAPRDWIIEGRARDLLLEFRRMQVGEPV